MDSKPYLIFNLDKLQYGVDAKLVKEISPMPELTPIPEAPTDIIGILNLRGEILPVIHLGLRLGRSEVFCQLSDLSDDDMLFLEEKSEQDQELPNELFLAFATPDLEITKENISIRFGSFFDRYCPHISSADREIFRQRAETLQVPLVNTLDSTGLYPLAIIDLGGEAFAIDLKLVQEFTSIRNLTHIPCCPSHIVGNMNLRGEIVTLVDIRSVLNLPAASVKIGNKTVVVKVEDIVAGLPVNEVSDVFYVAPSEIKPVPIASEGYLQGTIALFDRTLGILDLPKMMGGLVVNDE